MELSSSYEPVINILIPLTFFSILHSSAKSDVDNSNIFYLDIYNSSFDAFQFIRYILSCFHSQVHTSIYRYDFFLTFLFCCSPIFIRDIRIVSLFIFIEIRYFHLISVLLHLALLFSNRISIFFQFLGTDIQGAIWHRPAVGRSILRPLWSTHHIHTDRYATEMSIWEIFQLDNAVYCHALCFKCCFFLYAYFMKDIDVCYIISDSSVVCIQSFYSIIRRLLH